jgi:hypothetical protein
VRRLYLRRFGRERSSASLAIASLVSIRPNDDVSPAPALAVRGTGVRRTDPTVRYTALRVRAMTMLLGVRPRPHRRASRAQDIRDAAGGETAPDFATDR